MFLHTKNLSSHKMCFFHKQNVLLQKKSFFHIQNVSSQKTVFFTNLWKNRHLTRHKNMKGKRWGFMPIEQIKKPIVDLTLYKGIWREANAQSHGLLHEFEPKKDDMNTPKKANYGFCDYLIPFDQEEEKETILVTTMSFTFGFFFNISYSIKR